MAANAANSSPDVFLYLGHGNEEPVPYEERPLVPAGTTVVLLTTSGKKLDSTTASALLSEMQRNSDLFKDPLANKEIIEASNSLLKLRIYPEGSPMPVMNYWPESSMEPTYGTEFTFFEAGIFKFPFIPSLKYKRYESEVIPIQNIAVLYPGDENQPLRAQIQSMAEPHGVVPLQKIKSIRYTTPELVAAKGPGVHYFLNCRYVADLKVKSMGFISPTIKEYSDFVQSIKSPVKNRLQTIERALQKRNIPANTRKKLVQDKKDAEEELFTIWHDYELHLGRLQKIRNNTNTIPEDKLIYFRHALAKNSYLNANHQKHEPLSNENFNAQIRPKQNIASRHSTFKRNAVRKFNSVFGNLRTRLRLTRQKSQEFQRGLTKTRRRR